MERAADVVIGATFDDSFDTVIDTAQERVEELGDELDDALGRTRSNNFDLSRINTSLNESLRSTRNYRDEMKRGALDTLALGASLYAFISPAVEFEQMQARIADATNASASEMSALTALAQEQGRSTAFSAVQSAAAIEMLAKNGLTTAEILGGALTGSMELAAATGADLSMSADLATDVMANFGMAATDLADVNDGLVGTLKASKFDIDDYRLAIAQAGGVAGSMGVSLEDFNSVMAATSSQFASGSDAGTSFKTFLQRLVPASKEAATIMERYGLEFFDARGQMKSMAEVAEELREGLSGLSDEDLSNAMSKLFGTDAMRTAVGLMRQGGEGIDTVAARIASGGDAAAAADARMQGLQGALTRIKSATEGVAVTLGTTLLPAMADIVEGVTPVVNAVSILAEEYPVLTKVVIGSAVAFAALKVATFAGGYAFSFVKEGAIQAGRAVVFTAAAITGQDWTTMSGNVINVGQSFRTMAAGIRAASLAMVANPIGLTAMAVAAAVGVAASAVRKYWEPLSSFFSGVWDGISSTLSSMSEGLEPIISAFAPLQPVFDGIATAVGAVVQWFRALLTPVTQTEEQMQRTISAGRAVGTVVVGAIDTLLAPLRLAVWGFTNLSEAASNVFDWFVVLPTKVAEFGSEILNVFNSEGMYAAGRAIITGLWNGMKSMWADVVNWITERISALLDVMPDWVLDAMGIERQQRILSDAEISQQVAEQMEGYDEPRFNKHAARNQASAEAKARFADDEQGMFWNTSASDEVLAQREEYIARELALQQAQHSREVATQRAAAEARIRAEIEAGNDEVRAAREANLADAIGDTTVIEVPSETLIEVSEPLIGTTAPVSFPTPRPETSEFTTTNLMPVELMQTSAVTQVQPPTPASYGVAPYGVAPAMEAAVAEAYRAGAEALSIAMAQAVALEGARAAALAAERPRSITASVQAPITVNNYGSADAGGQAVRQGVLQSADDILAAERDQYVD